MKRKTMQTEEQSGAGLLARMDTEPDKAMEALVEQYTALVHLSVLWAQGQEGKKAGRDCG